MWVLCVCVHASCLLIHCVGFSSSFFVYWLPWPLCLFTSQRFVNNNKINWNISKFGVCHNVSHKSWWVCVRACIYGKTHILVLMMIICHCRVWYTNTIQNYIYAYSYGQARENVKQSIDMFRFWTFGTEIVSLI